MMSENKMEDPLGSNRSTKLRRAKFARFFSMAGFLFANILPVFGVLYWGWSLKTLLVLYWLESFIVGAVNVPQILVSNGALKDRISTAFFFMVHYGGFWLGHGLFLMIFLFPKLPEGPEGGVVSDLPYDSVLYVLLAMLVSHLFDFAQDIWRKPRAERFPPNTQLFVPYGRVFVMHIMILGGAALGAKYANATTFILMFTGLKIAFELFFMYFIRSSETYRKERLAS